MTRPINYYADKWASMRITRPAAVDRAARRILRSKPRYEAVEPHLQFVWDVHRVAP